MVVANGVTHHVAGETEIAAAAPSAVLVLPVGYSVFRRLAEAAAREGVDTNTLALSLVMYGLGQRLTRRASAPVREDDDSVQVGVVCLSCGRPRQDVSEPRCTTCRGSWTTAVR